MLLALVNVATACCIWVKAAAQDEAKNIAFLAANVPFQFCKTHAPITDHRGVI